MPQIFKEIRVVEDKNEKRIYVGQYFIKIIRQTDNTIIGTPVADEYDRVRVNIPKDEVKLYSNNENKIVKNKLYEINNHTPPWVNDYFS